MNGLDPNLMTTPERLSELADLLALGLLRLRSRQSSKLSRDSGESSLDCLAEQSGRVRVPSRRARA